MVLVLVCQICSNLYQDDEKMMQDWYGFGKRDKREHTFVFRIGELILFYP